MDWYTCARHRPEHLRLRPHDADELSHYSSATSDVEYLYPIGWSELEGIANRGDFDLTQHAEYSGEKLEYFDPQTRRALRPARDRAGRRRRPHGARAAVRRLRRGRDRRREAHRAASCTRALAPVKVAVLPLLRKDGHPEKAREIYELELRKHVQQPSTTRAARSASATGARTRSARRYGVTVDHQTLEDGTVTLRDRDTLTQERIAIDALPDELHARLAAPWTSPKLS